MGFKPTFLISIFEFLLSKVNAVKKAAEDGSPGTLMLIEFKYFFPKTFIFFFFRVYNFN